MDTDITRQIIQFFVGVANIDGCLIVAVAAVGHRDRLAPVFRHASSWTCIPARNRHTLYYPSGFNANRSPLAPHFDARTASQPEIDGGACLEGEARVVGALFAKRVDEDETSAWPQHVASDAEEVRVEGM